MAEPRPESSPAPANDSSPSPLASGIWHNWTTDAAVKRSLIAYDH
ncbi:hypothetical protein HNQ79_006563 [Streptomyces candidus]|uniref:Uncharacterized protein n=1 Tax=Streptomyces candidus TaxID=67283 RepID=A0A7X0HLS7_9ACTN|nr:hypothetical protein [Streptomyces candidus]